MELLPLGPVTIIDTPGYDDEGTLGEMRVKKTKEVLAICDIAVLVTENDTLSAQVIAQRAYGGEESALEVFSGLGDRLGEALEDIVRELHIDTLLMGGQISRSLSLMLRPLQNRLEGIRILPVPEGAVFEGLSSLFRNE